MTPLPVVYGTSERPPRGDYSRGGKVLADYTCPQNYVAYNASDHEIYARLYQRNSTVARVGVR